MLLQIIFIDSCAFYPPQKDEKVAMQNLWALEEKNIIQMEVTEATAEEMEQASARLKDKMESRLISSEAIGNTQEAEMLIGIKQLLFPDKKILAGNERRDIRNLFCVKKYGCDLFITVDSCHILKKADVIKERLGVCVIKPTQYLKIVSEELRLNSNSVSKNPNES